MLKGVFLAERSFLYIHPFKSQLLKFLAKGVIEYC